MLRVCLTLVAWLAVFAPSVVSASPIVDQGFDPGQNVTFGGGVGSGTGYQIAQTFTVGVAGLLTGIDLFINGTYLPGDLHFALLPTLAGAPDANSPIMSLTIASGSVPVNPPSYAPAFYFVDLSPFNVSVSVGEMLAFQLWATGNYGFGGQGNNPYAGGQFFERTSGSLWTNSVVAPSADMAFLTYVAPVPEPGTWLFVASGLMLLLVARLRGHLRG